MSIEATPHIVPVLRRRRTLLAAAIGVALLLYTLIGFFIVPRIIRSRIVSAAQENLHREARVGDVRFNPFTFVASVSNLRLLDRDGTDLLSVERFYVNHDTFGVFRWAWRFSEVRIEHPVVSARIMRDGKLSIADLLDSRPATTSNEPFKLPRAIVDRLTMAGGVVRFSDASRQPVYESRFEPLNLDVTDLVTIPREGGGHAITIGVGSRTQLKWTGRQTVEPLQFTGRLEITGLDLPSLWDYFEQKQPLDVREGRADISLPYEVRRGASNALDVALKGASLHLTGLTARPRDGMTDWLTVPELRVEGVNVAWPAARAEVARVALARPRVFAHLGEDGQWNWQRAFASDAPASSSGASAWTYAVAAVDVEGGVARVEAEAAPPPGGVDVTELTLHAANITSDTAASIPFTSSARVQDAGTLEVKGSLAPSPTAFDVTVGARALDLAALQPYLSLPAGTRVAAGSVSLQGQASMSAKTQAVNVTAEASVDGVELRDVAGERLIAWRTMKIDGFTREDPPNRSRVRAVTIDGLYAKVLIDPQGNLNLTRLGATTTGQRAGRLVVNPNAPRDVPTLEVGTVTIRDGATEFTDESLPLGKFHAEIHSANGTIRDLSSFAAAPATVAIEGRVDKTGYVKVGGTLRTSDPMAASEITMGFRSIEMVGLTPYFAEFAGYAVKSGTLDLDVRYQVQSRRLIGNHTLVAHDLVLGERVKDSKAPNFAIRLAVALLKDRQGRINLDVPIEGTVDSPEFAYRKVFWAAVRTILGNAAKAPFRALGRLFGRDEDDLELVEFDPGRSDLLPADQDMLGRLAEQLAQRDGISLKIEGRFDQKADTPALKRRKLDALIEARRPAATAAAPAGSSALETILESLFVEQFSAEQLQAERQRFGAPAVAPPASTGPAAGAQIPVPATATAQPSAPAPPPATAATPPQAFDAPGFYEALRQRLLEAQTVGPADLNALATARADAILAVLTKSPSFDRARITSAEPAAVKRSKAGSSRIASEMTLSAGSDGD